jgi:hypothetical protein
MASKPTGAAPDIAPDPAAMDDRAEPEAAAARVDAPAREEAVSEPLVRPELIEDTKREEIALRYRELRDAEEAEVAEARAELEATRQQAQQAADTSQPSQPQRVKVIVDGREEFVPLDQLVRGYQINKASDNRLEEAKRLLAEAKATVRNQPAEHRQEYEPEQPRPQPSAPNERLKSIVERIQIGDSDEGAQAMEELAGELEKRAQIKAFQNQHSQELLRAVNNFGAKNPNIVSDPDLAQTGMTILARTMAADIEALGLKPEAVDAIRHNVRDLAFVAAALRQGGHKSGHAEEVPRSQRGGQVHWDAL